LLNGLKAGCRRFRATLETFVAGAYVVLASMWGSLGGLLVLTGIVVDWDGNTRPGLIVGLVGIALLAMAFVRLTQSRRARQSGRP
jgi:ABC-type proline/glycine betaine transport system permease subunit